MTEPIQEKQLKWILVDFDKTIATNSDYPEYKPLKPVDGAKKYLDRLVKDGWKITIYTSRPWNDYDLIEKWLDKWSIPHRRIICGKAFGKYIIDDRAIEFRGNWEETFNKIK